MNFLNSKAFKIMAVIGSAVIAVCGTLSDQKKDEENAKLLKRISELEEKIQ